RLDRGVVVLEKGVILALNLMAEAAAARAAAVATEPQRNKPLDVEALACRGELEDFFGAWGDASQDVRALEVVLEECAIAPPDTQPDAREPDSDGRSADGQCLVEELLGALPISEERPDARAIERGASHARLELDRMLEMTDAARHR